jgi:diguanylate cyclase (GGDEF)-like protein
VGGSGGDPKNEAGDTTLSVLELEPRADAGGGGAGRSTVVTNAPNPDGPWGNDCLVVIYTEAPTLLGRCFVLDRSLITIGSGPENDIVLNGDGVSREHAQLEQRSGEWWVTDMGSTIGSYVNDVQITGDCRLRNGCRLKIGPTILKSVGGEFAETLYHEEIYRMTIIDGLTQVHVKRYFLESLEKEIRRARRHARELCVLRANIDHLGRLNDVHGRMAGDHVLKEVARIIGMHLRRDQLLSRYGGDEFTVLLPDTTLDNAVALGEVLRAAVETSRPIFQGETVSVTISVGVASIADSVETGRDLTARAGVLLNEAKIMGHNRIGRQR